MTRKSDIKQLVKRCKNQEWFAQKELYLLYADELMSIAIRYSNDLSAAKDLVQETFLILFKKIDQYDEEKGNLGAWLSRILINYSFKEYRKNKKMIFSGEAAFEEEESTETSIIEQLEAEDILNLLKELPKGCRTIFNLNVIEGYRHTEIGDILNISASASRAQLTRAKKLLRALIETRMEANKVSISDYQNSPNL